MRRLAVAALIGLIGLGGTMTAQVQRFAGPAQFPFSSATKADGLVYVAGTIAAEGDIRNQTRKVLESIDQALQKAGSSLAMAASIQVYIKNASDFAAMNEVYRTFWKTDPPARTTIVSDFVVPGALLEISAIAIPTGGDRQVIHPSSWMKSPNPYSYGIKSGSTLFLAGLVSRNGKDNSVVEGPMAVQTKAALDNAGEILKAAGMTFDNVVSSRVFITDGAQFQDMNNVYRTVFTKDPPARATVVAPLMGAANVVEITLTASSLPKQVFTTPAADGTPGKPSPILSSAVKVGNRLYLSGLLGNTAANKGDTEAQTTELLARVGRTLQVAGFGWGDLVDGVVYLTDTGNFDAMNRGYRAAIKELPARATVKAGLVSPEGLLEIMFVASK
ncbi:MAG: RidA family protein [Acidobacteria bacterium]|nr:RidA family protein [Acidobacteriota bacterium]